MTDYLCFGFKINYDETLVSRIALGQILLECLTRVGCATGLHHLDSLPNIWKPYHGTYRGAKYMITLTNRHRPTEGFMIAFNAKYARQAMQFRLQYDVIPLE